MYVSGTFTVLVFCIPCGVSPASGLLLYLMEDGLRLVLCRGPDGTLTRFDVSPIGIDPVGCFRTSVRRVETFLLCGLLPPVTITEISRSPSSRSARGWMESDGAFPSLRQAIFDVLKELPTPVPSQCFFTAVPFTRFFSLLRHLLARSHNMSATSILVTHCLHWEFMDIT
ncbi:hypothetical protein F5Y06DRAFT_235957 [Hypoxylon sp. FL0890]|nr:hypothetical protein F5Y06DRAFT_235957 [Hypoxylon sp. FL0890]